MKFDLTTKEGLNDVLKRNFINVNPIFMLVMYVSEKLFIESEDKQREMAKEIIAEGKKQGVDELEIKVKNFRGGKLNFPVDKDIKIETHLGQENKMIIKVKYK